MKLAVDVLTFGAMVVRNYNYVYWEARKKGLDDDDARDLTMNVFIKAWKAWPNFSGKGYVTQERAWLKMILEHTWIDDWKKIGRRPQTVSTDAPVSDDGSMTLGDTLGGEALGGDECVARMHYQILVRGLLDLFTGAPQRYGLTKDDTAQFEAYHLDEMTIQEVAAAFGQSTPNVKMAIARVEQVMRTLIAAEPDASLAHQQRVAFDAAFDAVLDQFEQVMLSLIAAEEDARQADQPRVAFDAKRRFLKDLQYFRGYYSNANPSLALTHAVLGNASTSSQANTRVRPHFCFAVEQKFPDLMSSLKQDWNEYLARLRRTRFDKILETLEVALPKKTPARDAITEGDKKRFLGDLDCFSPEDMDCSSGYCTSFNATLELALNKFDKQKRAHDAQSGVSDKDRRIRRHLGNRFKQIFPTKIKKQADAWVRDPYPGSDQFTRRQFLMLEYFGVQVPGLGAPPKA